MIRKDLQRELKEATGRCHQLFSGHTSIGSYLAEKVNVVQSSACWWCGSGERFTLSSGVESGPPRAEILRELRVEVPKGPIRQAAFQRRENNPSGPNLPMRHGGWEGDCTGAPGGGRGGTGGDRAVPSGGGWRNRG